MKFSNAITYALAASSSVHALSTPKDMRALAETAENIPAEYIPAPASLEKRKGGGGGGGRGGGGGSGGGRGGSGGGGSPGRGPPRAYGGGGGYYGGGAATPYNTGQRSPKGIVPFAIGGAALGLLFVGTWAAAGAYVYPYGSNYRFRNETANRDEDLPVRCVCAADQLCACDENTDEEYIKSLIGDGDYNKLNKTLVQVTEPNGTKTLVLNGTLPPGTEAPTASAGHLVLEKTGYMVLAAAMGYALMV